jgi:hypothetical protein
LREITANVMDTDTKITYSGTALAVAAGDWFIVLPPTNFRWVGSIFNDYENNKIEFRRLENRVHWLPASIRGISCTVELSGTGTVIADNRVACPWPFLLGPL